MNAEDVYSSEILCPQGCFWKNNNNPYESMASGIFTIATHSADGTKQYDIARLSFENGVLSGKAVFYNENNQEVYEYVNNKKNGWGVKLFDSSEITKLYYENGHLLRKMERSSIREDYWKEMDVASGSLLGYFKLDDNNNRIGIGYCYCNGDIEGVYEFDNDERGECLKWMEDGIMKEYLNGEEVYCGEFVNSFELDFPRPDLSNPPHLYKGGVQNDLPEGEGTLFNTNGDVVNTGVWRKGLIEVEEGMWFDYLSQQHCGLYADGNRKYEGDMVHGIPEGGGVYYNRDGVMLYVGSWKNGYYQIDSSTTYFSYRSETLCLLYGNGNVKYEGAVINDLPEGFGKYYDRDGNVKYEGEWKNGLIEVSDCTRFDITSENFIVYYADGCKKYEGKMNDDTPDGDGVYYSEDGIMKYSGIWRNGLIKIEEGMWFDYLTSRLCGLYADGSKKYDGEMNNGLPDGYGVYYDQNGNVKYEGEWTDGRLNLLNGGVFDYQKGICQLLFENGIVFYEGDVKDGVADGHGQIVDEQGNPVFVGEWNNGVFDICDGVYVMIDNGRVFIHEHVNGCFGYLRTRMKKWDGKSSLIYENGKKRYAGEVVNGIPHGEIEMRIMRTVIEKSKETLKEVMKWMKTKTGKIVMRVTLTMILLILLIVGIVDGWFFKMGSGFEIKDGVLIISGGDNIKGNFKISGYKTVKSIVVEYGSLRNVKSVIITSKIEFDFYYQDLPQLTTFTTGDWSFCETTSLSLSSI